MLVCSSGEIERVAGRALLVKILEQRAVVWQVLHIKRDGLGNERLEGGFAGEQMAGQAEDQRGTRTQQGQQ